MAGPLCLAEVLKPYNTSQITYILHVLLMYANLNMSLVTAVLCWSQIKFTVMLKVTEMINFII